MNTDIDFLGDLRTEFVRLEQAPHRQPRRVRAAALLAACAVVVIVALVAVTRAVHSGSDAATAAGASRAAEQRLLRSLPKSSVASAEPGPTLVAPTLGHPYGRSREISYALAREVAPWLALPASDAGPPLSAPARVWAARAFASVVSQPGLMLSLYYPAADVQLTEYRLARPVSPAGYIERTQGILGLNITSRQVLTNAGPAASAALIMDGRRAGMTGNAVALVINRTVVALYGTMPLDRMESLAATLSPDTDR